MAEDSIRAEFQCKKLGLNHPNPEIFTQSQWPLPRSIYLGWRGFWCLWHVVWCIVGGVHTSATEGSRWFTHVGNLVFLATTITALLDFCLVLAATLRVRDTSTESLNTQDTIEANGTDKDEIIFQGEFILEEDLFTEPTACPAKFLWMLYNVVNCCNLLVTLMHWAVEHDGKADAVEVTVHGLNTLFVCVNLLVTAMPVQILHFLYPAAFVAIYFLFSLIYFLADGTASSGSDVIYQAVDWNSAFPTTLTIILGMFVAVPLGHLTMFAVYTFRLFLYSKSTSDSYSFSGEPKRFKKPDPTASNPNSSVYVTGVE